MPRELPQTPDYEKQRHRPILQDDEILVELRKQSSNGKIAIYPGEMVIANNGTRLSFGKNEGGMDGWFDSAGQGGRYIVRKKEAEEMIEEVAEKCQICGCMLDSPAPEWCPAVHELDETKLAHIVKEVKLRDGTVIEEGTLVSIVAEGNTNVKFNWTDGDKARSTTLNKTKIEKCAG